jgi:hypothetical protein
VTADDIRTELAIVLERQISIAKWALLMLRLVFLSDIGFHAPGSMHSIRKLRRLPVLAAEGTGNLSYSSLHNWVKREGAKFADRALSPTAIERIKEEVRAGDNDA